MNLLFFGPILNYCLLLVEDLIELSLLVLQPLVHELSDLVVLG